MNSITLTAVHCELPVITSKQILKSMIGSLNATAIAYARGHLRYAPAEQSVPADEVNTIDKYNDAQAALAEANEQQQAASGMGFNTQMQSGELATRLMYLRGYFAQELLRMQATANDVPLSIAETVKFQMERQPTTDEAMLEALAAAVEIDVEVLKAGKLEMDVSDAADLKANAGKIITFLSKFEDNEVDDAAAVEACIDELPAHVVYKLMFAATRAYDKANKRALQALLRGKLDAAGDIKMLKAQKEAALVWLKTLSIARAAELNDYLERGGNLPEIEDRTIVSAQQKAAAAPQVQVTKSDIPTDVAPIGSCEVKHQPMTGPTPGKARRAPRPKKEDATA